MSTKCPRCGHRSFQVVIRQMADVTFTEDGDHEVTDGPYGDLDFDDGSAAICATRDCGWTGTLEEAAQEDLKPYTVLLLRPDYMADSFGQDTYMTCVEAKDPVEALALARKEVIECDHGPQPGMSEFYDHHDPTDYACLMLIEGEHRDINPER